MPANLTPQYKSAEARYKAAQTTTEKIDALEEMLRTIPKHKGTEKLCADIKHRISKTRKQQELANQSTKKGISYHIPKEGAAQIVLTGTPNSGKSAILAGLTNANALVADYPYTTQKPLPGMFEWENIRYQLIDLPPISDDYFEPWIPGLIRVSDMVVIVVAMDDIEGYETIIKNLNDHKIELVSSFQDSDYTSRIVRLPALIMATKMDLSDSAAGLELIREATPGYQVIPVSHCSPADGLRLGRLILETLDLLRVYTKAPGKDANMEMPVVMRRGSSLLDVCIQIHKDFAEELKFARVWGSGKFDGQRIQRDYIIEEGDVFEFKL